MPHFSERSLSHLGTCHPDLIRLFEEVIISFDCTVLEGYRSPERQDELMRTGKSRTMKSKHLEKPSMAIDVAPYPIDWTDTRRFYFFAGYVKAWAHGLEIDLRWGGDWDGDGDFSDQTFFDLVHYELRTP
jgi:peptidoglycan L-alanyl-D-glutamate endopeptidase CwlK